MATGATIFVIGLFKKVALADHLAPYADRAFAAAGAHVGLTFAEAWIAALAYALQLYLDFSGYSEMAIGLARMFGITFPLNFFSPYRAADISEFWQRWHMTLSRFLRDYLYIPLGGNRKGIARRYVNLMVTMLLGGLWHGAAWAFVVWGGMHGAYLCIHHAWRAALEKLAPGRVPGPLEGLAGRALTFVAVVFAWVVFRAASVPTALSMWAAMLGLHAHTTGAPDFFPHVPIAHAELLFVAILLAAVVALPNAEQFMTPFHESVGAERWIRPETGLRRIRWTPTAPWAAAVGTIGAVAIILSMNSHTFLYFWF
jgi:D-alanyl-lipoteichoic acid acyltransferase DltB (MBOAT superfamily)